MLRRGIGSETEDDKDFSFQNSTPPLLPPS